MKSKSIKLSIINIFFISGIYAFILTCFIFIAVFGIMHILNHEFYIYFLKIYNTSETIMIVYLLVIFSLFILVMFFIFIKKMNGITDYIEEISKVVNKVSEGNMDTFISIRRKDELGELAENVNSMIYSLKGLIEKEREWDRQKNNLITNLSHDLRTPLTSILGFLHLIENDISGNEKLKHYCSICLIKAEKLKELIGMLFEFSRLNNADLKLNKSKISLEELIEQITMGFIPDFDKYGMEYRILKKSRGLKINADPIMLARAFENIISNSIKYASEGKYLDIVVDSDENNAIVKFINYGEKIKQDDIRNIFDKFYRSEKNCDKREGTGLGMAIVKAIVELHSGEINIRSTNEKTEFEFKIPCFL